MGVRRGIGARVRPNSSAIACDSHSTTELLEQEPVWAGCAVPVRFALKMTFFDEDDLVAFRGEYAAIPLHETAMETRLLAGSGLVATLVTASGFLLIGGVI